MQYVELTVIIVLAAIVQIIIVEIPLYIAADLNVPMMMNAHTT
jgi:hypothetical protein